MNSIPTRMNDLNKMRSNITSLDLARGAMAILVFLSHAALFTGAVGRFEDEFIHSMEKYGFTVEEVIPIRVADKEYVDEIWPHLRKEARQRDRDRVAILDVVFIARRNG